MNQCKFNFKAVGRVLCDKFCANTWRYRENKILKNIVLRVFSFISRSYSTRALERNARGSLFQHVHM